jgi:hypothetical protein
MAFTKKVEKMNQETGELETHDGVDSHLTIMQAILDELRELHKKVDALQHKHQPLQPPALHYPPVTLTTTSMK